MSSHQPKHIISGDDARQALLRGVNTLANAVGATLGPRGRNSIIEQHYGLAYPLSTRDGVKVAESISLSDPVENLGAQMVRQVASKTSKVAGDGTTTATVLAQAIFREGVKAVTAGANPMSLKRGIDAAVQVIVGTRNDAGEFEGGTLAKFSQPVSGDMIAQVGTISANQDSDIGKTIAEAMERVGKNGVVTVEESQSLETQLDVVEGMQFDRGYLSPYFVTNGERMEANLAQNGDVPVYILLYEKSLSYHTELDPIAGAVKQSGGSLLVVAEDVTGGALAFLAINKMQGLFQSIAVKAPGMGDRRKALLEDLAILTGATLITPELGIKAENITLKMLGTAKRVTVTKDDTTIVGGGGDSALIEGRKEELKAAIERCVSDFDRPKLEERLAKLSGGVAVVKVGAATEAEMKEKVPLVRNAVNATRAAVAEGVLPGGGVALIRAVGVPEFHDGLTALQGDERIGMQLVVRACQEPLRRIAANAGKEGGEVVGELHREWRQAHAQVDVLNKMSDLEWAANSAWGWNAATDTYGDLIKEGILDPTRVTRTALQSAGSIAGLLLITESLVVDDLDTMKKVKDALPQGTGGMPGMY